MHVSSRCAFLLVVALVAGLWFLLRPGANSQTLQGEVTDGENPLPEVRVHLQGQAHPATTTDRHGRFRLPAISGKAPLITASKPGFALGAISSDTRPLHLTLNRLPATDNADYSWLDPRPDPLQANNCGNCHGEIYREWSGSAHAHAADNLRLRNLLAGTDWHERPSPTWNLQAEHPLGASVCASCHAPTFSDPTLVYDLRKASGVASQGVHCDYCHKVVDAPTDKLGTRFGRDGLVLLRPPDQQQLFFGPLDDAFRVGESFGHAPLYQESRYCASCHEGVVFGVHVYGTYSEWLASPARRQGQQCQTCHMAPTGTLTNIAPGKGGIDRDPQSLASHGFPGGQVEMLRRCLKLSMRLTPEPDSVTVHVEVLAENVGHRLPTGFIDRNLLLVVEGLDRQGKPTHLLAGPKLPPSAGRALAGSPGYLYARQLRTQDGHPLPFWLAHEEPEDTRLFPGRLDRRQFRFAADTASVRVRLVYRRFWQEVAENKGWPDNEVLIIAKAVSLRGSP
jgi:hypothetical protein